MRHIVKRARWPDELVQYRNSSAGAENWDGMPAEHKNAVRDALLEDQRNVCCYCMRRIDAESMKVEHYRPQSRYPAEVLSWKNLLAACRGNEGGPWHQQTCDTRKQDTDLVVDPLRADSVRDLRYLADGRIKSNSEEVDDDLNERLNLNFRQLRESRKQVLDALVTILSKRYGKEARWTRSQLERELERLRESNPYPAFIGLLEYWLMKFRQARE